MVHGTRVHPSEKKKQFFASNSPPPPLAILTASFRLSSLSSFCVAGRRFACISYIIAAMSMEGEPIPTTKNLAFLTILFHVVGVT